MKWLTPPQLGRELGIDPGKVIAWIKKGELSAVNVATATSGRPRWRISQAELDAFINRRQSRPAAAPVRRRRSTEAIQFF